MALCTSKTVSSKRATGLDLDFVADDFDLVADDDLDFVADDDLDFVADDDLSGSLYLYPCPAKGPQVSTSPSCISAPSQPHISVGPPTVFHSDLLCVFFAPSQIYHLHFIRSHQFSMFSGV